MATDGALSLRERFRSLQQERERTWSEAALAINAGQRAALRRTHDVAAHIQPGDTLSDTVVEREDGTRQTLDALLGERPAVLLFFRFSGCPACNIALPYYRDTLWPGLKAAGVRLFAISPQPFPALGEIAARHDLPFGVVRDVDLALARALGVTYRYDDASRAASEARGDRPEALNGTSEWELPKPAIVIVDGQRRARFVDVTPDWMDRTESDDVLAALAALDLRPAVQESFHAA